MSEDTPNLDDLPNPANPETRGWRWPSLHELLSSSLFWVLVMFFGLAAVVVALVVQQGKINRVDRARTARIAEVRAGAQSNYQMCVRSIPTLTKVNGFVRGVEEAHRILVINAIATHRVTPVGSPLYNVQKVVIARLRDTVRLVTIEPFPVPTKAECAAARTATLTALANDP